MSFPVINSFLNVTVLLNSLIVLDIDETILKMKDSNTTWFSDKFKHYKQIYNDDVIANNKTIDDYLEYSKLNKAVHTDKLGLNDLFQRATKYNCKVIMLTARDLKLKDITHEQLKYLEIPIVDIHFCEGKNKGDQLNKFITENKLNNNTIIFIDDREKYLEQVRDKITDRDLHLYQFVLT